MNIVNALTPVNHLAGRQGNRVRYIILHTIVGTIDGAQSRFFNPSSQVSTHYGVGMDGVIHRWVGEENTAYGCGSWTYNLQSINIEHEDKGNYNDPVRTDALYNATIELCADICRRYGLPADRSTFKMHKEVIDKRYFPGGTACPDGLDIDRIINGTAQALLPPPVAEPEKAPAAAQSEYTRFDEPMQLVAGKQPTNVYELSASSWGTLSAAVVKQLNQGDPFVAVGKAKHPLGGTYFMTAYSFGQADVTGTPDHNYGVNSVDLSPAPAPVVVPVVEVSTPTPDNPPLASASPPMTDVVPVAPVSDTAWKTVHTDRNGKYESLVSQDVHDIVTHATIGQELLVGQPISIAGYYEKDGVRYALTQKAIDSGLYYDIKLEDLRLVDHEPVEVNVEDNLLDDLNLEEVGYKMKDAAEQAGNIIDKARTNAKLMERIRLWLVNRIASVLFKHKK